MSATHGRPSPDHRPGLYDHALRLHRLTPDDPLPRDGEPFPDAELHEGPGPERPLGRGTQGVGVVRVLDAHFARPSAPPEALAPAFHDVHVPIHPDDGITAAALRHDPDQVRAAGRWLVRHGDDQCAVTVGLALLAATGTAEDIPLVRTIGLLSNHFGPLAAHALERLDPSARSLLWLADRTASWGRVYVVEALCRLDHPDARPWLLRRAIDGDFLNGYFAGTVATTARLHEQVEHFAADHELLDHTGRLLAMLAYASGMGTTLRHYPHSATVLRAHLRAVSALRPTVGRLTTLAALTRQLTTAPAQDSGCTEAQRASLLAAHLALLDREDWYRATCALLEKGNDWVHWFAGANATEVPLRAFAGWVPDDDEHPRPPGRRRQRLRREP
ncbi:hypothetical protein AB0F71_11970 [Kitasatospora sp. NPDC028055]|uniref:hypothetical protein n=1 Tax=Kitasatospora sp. NPDC028055 TaxID=3155653 RepID=UPI0033F3581B